MKMDTTVEFQENKEEHHIIACGQKRIFRLVRLDFLNKI
jgi:hypothetical protein